QGVVYVLIGSIFFAYLIYPIVQWLRRRMPLVLAIIIVYAAIVACIFIAGWFIIPRIADEAQTLTARYPQIVARLQDMIDNPSDPVTSRLPGFLREELARVPSQLVAWLKVHGAATFGHVI